MAVFELTPEERRIIEQRRNRKAMKREFGSKLASRPKVDKVRDHDADYMAWLHDQPCIGCIVLGPAPRESAHIEAAHQKLQRAERGWNRTLGRRSHDRQCVPLCAWHHRLGPTCCDPAQRKFWETLGLTVDDVIDFATDLYAAFQAEARGAPVIHRFARRALNAGESRPFQQRKET